MTTFDEAAAFVTGMGAATEWRFLEGFRVWLASRSDLGANIAWQVLVIRIAYPGESNDFWVAASHGESGEAITVLFDEFNSYLKDWGARNAE
ncbi:hypothetical protein [Streptomyces sp. MUM 16J]|uniref:hypothetical protein n=1 Tax=Streptomyces sp. MUM 16J TaxID=2791988 RepID=UPI001F0355C1|nr:hypothetical protein [Streptomyces sp. MUM 16J]MCH0558420.1 hypothetical protein [Streptomyces sp. MUM 16J]